MTIIQYKTVNVDGLDVFYREAGDPSKPAFVRLHGFPSSSSMFRNLMPLLARNFHVLAPDLIGFGNSAAPSRESFEYTFENLTKNVAGFLAALKVDQYFLKAGKETRSFKDVMNCLFLCP
ncbi:alpha/beta fold hydrolase, partial [Limosilactobacillus fermentum]